MSHVTFTGSNWGQTAFDDEAVCLQSSINDPLIKLPFDKIESCTQFRNDVKIQMRKSVDESLFTGRKEAFYTSPYEVKLSMGQDQENEEEDFQPTYSSAKKIHGSINAQIAKHRTSIGFNDSAELTGDSDRTEILRMSSLPTANPHGYFDVIVTSSSFVMIREKKTATSEETAQTRFEIPHSRVHCTFLLPFPLTQTGARTYARKYFVLGLSEPVMIGSTKHSYIVFSVDDDDAFTVDEPLKTSLKTPDEVQSIFKGKVVPEEASFNENSTCMEIVGPKSELLAKIIKGLTGKKVIGQSTFHNASSPEDTVAPYVRCMHKSSSGHLYLLEKSFLFLHKPVLFVSYEDVSECSIEADSPYAKTCAIQLSLKNFGGDIGNSKNILKFTSMPNDELSVVKEWFSSKGISIKAQSPDNENMELDSESSDESAEVGSE